MYLQIFLSLSYSTELATSCNWRSKVEIRAGNPMESGKSLKMCEKNTQQHGKRKCKLLSTSICHRLWEIYFFL